jgi:hypothetical protein
MTQTAVVEGGEREQSEGEGRKVLTCRGKESKKRRVGERGSKW